MVADRVGRTVGDAGSEVAVTGIVTVVALVLAVGVMALTGRRAARDRPVERPELLVSALLELAALVYVGARVVDLARGHRVDNLVVLVICLAAVAVVMPVAGLLGYAERTRWGPVVLGAGALVLSVLFARVDQLWTTRG